MRIPKISINISPGELMDRLSILTIKRKLITDSNKLMNVCKELLALQIIYQSMWDSLRFIHPMDFMEKLSDLYTDLEETNLKLWMIEDELRDYERVSNFGEKFIQAARGVYYTNDKRSVIKREIDTLLGSAILEEKSYKEYQNETKPSSDG